MARFSSKAVSVLRPFSGVTSQENWTSQHSDRLYRISQWGEENFQINTHGHLCWVDRSNKRLFDLYQFATEHGSSPLLLRFPDILKARQIEQVRAFQEAITTCGYRGEYIPAYPTKSNQAKDVLKDILEASPDNPYCLEVGSKAELAEAIMLSRPGHRMICGGYKDRAYLELAIIASRLGLEVFIVIEQLAELDFLKGLDDLGQIKLGLRLKLSTEGKGHWAGSIGNRSKFGLSSSQILIAFDQIKAANQLDRLQLLHYHPGSQISSLDGFVEPLTEAARIYQDLSSLGAPLAYLDLGGGAAIDYHGTDDPSEFSANYNLQGYALTLVKQLKILFARTQMKEPHIITENGKAILAHASMLIVPLLTSDHPAEFPAELKHSEDPVLITQLFEDYENLRPETLDSALADLSGISRSIVKAFRQGKLNLREKAKAESLYWAYSRRVYQLASQKNGTSHQNDHFQWLERQLATVYLANFSLFRSLPDLWALGQLFPILPIQKLNQEPTNPAHLADLTCDSDGMIKSFLVDGLVANSLPLHPLPDDEPYLIGVFLTGAYQEILGNAHNLFGELPLYEISASGCQYEGDPFFKVQLINKPIGSDLQDMLHLMQFSSPEIDRSVDGLLLSIPSEHRSKLKSDLLKLLSGSTYLDASDYVR